MSSILAAKGQPVKLPVEVGCKLSKPCYKFDKVVKHFVNIASQNLKIAGTAIVKSRINKEKKKITNRVKNEVNKATKRLDKNTKGVLKDTLKGLGF